MKKVWIIDPVDFYANKRPKPQEVNANKVRNSPYSPPRMVKFYPHRGSDKWHYCYWGPTRQECVESYNTWVQEKLTVKKAELKKAQEVVDDLLALLILE